MKFYHGQIVCKMMQDYATGDDQTVITFNATKLYGVIGKVSL